jgi:TPR repeat protein
MATATTAVRMDQAIREYIRACNDGDAQKIAACLHADAVHYYPNLPKLSGASALAAHFARRVKEGGVHWTVDQIVVDAERCIGVLEFTMFAGTQLILRGLELYEFEPETLRILEVRPYTAAPVDFALPNQQLQDFDYVGRGYPVTRP